MISLYPYLYIQIVIKLQALYYLALSTYTDNTLLSTARSSAARILIGSYPVRFPPFLDARHPTSDPGQGPPFLR